MGEIVLGVGILAIGLFFVVVVPLAGKGAHVDVAAADHLVHRIDQIRGAAFTFVARADLLALFIIERGGTAQRFVGQGLGLIGVIVLRLVVGFRGGFAFGHRGSPDRGFDAATA